MAQLNLFGVPEHQESTCQVPCGPHSIWDALEAGGVTQSQCWIAQVLNQFSNWSTGVTHAYSYTELAKHCGMPRTSVISGINALIEMGWIEKNIRNQSEKHDQNTPNTYRLTHHKCKPSEIPLDKDGTPLRCAVPTGQGSAYQMVKDGRITWQEGLYWLRMKVEFDEERQAWKTGIVKMTIARAKQVLRMTTKTVCAIRKTLKQVGMMEQLSKPFQAFVCQLFPKPYEKRRKRRQETPKGLPYDADHYYSFNRLWRVSRRDGSIQAKNRGSRKWRYSNEGELARVNSKVLAAFKPIIDLVTSPYWQQHGEGNRV